MSNEESRHSFKEVTNREAWVGYVSMQAAAKALKQSGRDFVISGGIRDNHYILTCRSELKGAVCHHVRYDSIHAGWKNTVGKMFKSLDELIDAHIDIEALVALA